MTPPNLTPADDRDRLFSLIGNHRYRKHTGPNVTNADRELWAAAGLEIGPHPSPAAAAEPPAHDANARAALHDIGRAIGHPFTLGTTAAHMRDTILQRLGIKPNTSHPAPAYAHDPESLEGLELARAAGLLADEPAPRPAADPSDLAAFLARSVGRLANAFQAIRIDAVKLEAARNPPATP